MTHLERGSTRDRDALLQILGQAGYQRTSLVEEAGEVAARGGILDLFPPHLRQPVRLEFEFDEIGSIYSNQIAAVKRDGEWFRVDQKRLNPMNCFPNAMLANL